MLVQKSAWHDVNGDYHPPSTYEYGGMHKWKPKATQESEFHPRSSGPRNLSRHPRAAFFELWGKCSKCHIQVDVALQRNGGPTRLVGDFTDRKWMPLLGGEYKHLGCKGHLVVYGLLPKGFTLATLHTPERRKPGRNGDR